jgi:hypothetical protein
MDFREGRIMGHSLSRDEILDILADSLTIEASRFSDADGEGLEVKLFLNRINPKTKEEYQEEISCSQGYLEYH